MGQFLKVHNLCTPMSAYIFFLWWVESHLLFMKNPSSLEILLLYFSSFPTECDLSIEFRP